MARLTLQFEDRVVKEFSVGASTTIGRMPDNTIMVDSPAVSSHHACVFRDGDRLVVEDLQSTNGTFVNGRRVSRQALEHGDVVQVGKHQLVLDQLADGEPAAADESALPVENEGETIFVDRRKLLAKLMLPGNTGRKYDALVARLRDVESQASRSPDAGARPSSGADRVGVLRVLDGRADRAEYVLEAHTSLIGKGKSSLVRLRGWFTPNVAVAITRNRQGYVATLIDSEVRVNSKPASGRYELKEGDLLDVSGLILEFRLGK
jgi:pSer/pThr/pTyr-binding forkhead associated (FHA) protein